MNALAPVRVLSTRPPRPFARRRSAVRWRLPLAIALSVAAHLAAVGTGYVVATLRPAEPVPDMAEPAQVSLLPVEQIGAGEPVPDATPAEPESSTATATSPQAEAPAHEALSPSESAAAEPPPTAGSADAHESPAPPPEPPSRRAETEPVPRPEHAQAAPLVMNLGGTEAESNAITQGDGIIPASPDDRYRNKPPIYPREAQRRGQGGTVVVLIRVSPVGTAAGAQVIESSGYPLLDQAALDAVRTWRFRPALSRGTGVAFDMPMRFVFELQ